VKRRGIVLEPKQAALTAAQQEEALGLVRAGESVQQVATKLEISPQALRRFVKDKDVIPSNQQPRLTPEQQQEVLGLVRQGVSLREVVKQFGVSPPTIRRIVKRLEASAERDRAPDT
jgi:DNA-binding NarL/FixJ family response regulator